MASIEQKIRSFREFFSLDDVINFVDDINKYCNYECKYLEKTLNRKLKKYERDNINKTRTIDFVEQIYQICIYSVNNISPEFIKYERLSNEQMKNILKSYYKDKGD